MKHENTIVAFSILVCVAVPAFAYPVSMNVDHDATVYTCSEKVTKTDNEGQTELRETGPVSLVDYGNSFFVLSPKMSATAFSGRLSYMKGDKSVVMSQPVKGITMMKGMSPDTRGTYGYIGAQDMITWDCRR